VELLNDMLDEYFDEDGTDWPRAPLPCGLRDSTFEVINTLVTPPPPPPRPHSPDSRHSLRIQLSSRRLDMTVACQILHD